jgi:hypothetical protein
MRFLQKQRGVEKMLRLSYKNLTYLDHDPRTPDLLGFRIVGGFLRGWLALAQG